MKSTRLPSERGLPSGRPSIRRQRKAATQGERLREYFRSISPLTLSRPHLFRGRIEGCPLGRWVRGHSLRQYAGGLLLTLACVLPTHAQTEQAQDAILREIGIDQHLNEQIPLDLTFRDEAGQSVQLGQYFGKKPVILALVYYQCPMLCTLTLNGLVSALKVLSFDVGNQFNVVTVSFNPSETPQLAAQKKQTYLKSYGRAGADAGWHFLTGDEANIKRLTEAVGFRYRWVPEQNQFAHAAGITVLTPSGKIARYFFGVEYAPRDLRLGLVEASQERIGSPVDQLLLYCFHYDPATGKYGAVVMNIVRLGGAVTVLLLGGALLVMWRRERRPHGPVEVTR
jgi:protein SCO1/2